MKIFVIKTTISTQTEIYEVETNNETAAVSRTSEINPIATKLSRKVEFITANTDLGVGGLIPTARLVDYRG